MPEHLRVADTVNMDPRSPGCARDPKGCNGEMENNLCLRVGVVDLSPSISPQVIGSQAGAVSTGLAYPARLCPLQPGAQN